MNCPARIWRGPSRAEGGVQSRLPLLGLNVVQGTSPEGQPCYGGTRVPLVGAWQCLAIRLQVLSEGTSGPRVACIFSDVTHGQGPEDRSRRCHSGRRHISIYIYTSWLPLIPYVAQVLVKYR